METSFNKEQESIQEQDFKPKRRWRKITLNISDTKYPIIPTVARILLNWRVSRSETDENWDLFWTDGGVMPEKLAKMKSYQKINHFPGMAALSRKSNLARNIYRIKRTFKKDYNFIPRTWLWPSDYPDLRNQMQKGMVRTVIVKPEALSQGKGIYLARKIDDIDPEEVYVWQEYIRQPFLIDGLKFDLRIYVLVTGWHPLRIFVHEEGLTRLATVPYEQPNLRNMEDMCMHLTNYAINKTNPNFVVNQDYDTDDVGHKRSLQFTYDYLEGQGHDVEALKENIDDIIIKTLISVQPSISHTYRSCQPKDISNNMCFEILGLDIMLNSQGKPFLLEVNHSPSFNSDSPLDKEIKKKVVYDSLVLMNVTSMERKEYYRANAKQINQRTMSRKAGGLSQVEIQLRKAKAIQDRNEHEAQNLGGFTKIYPTSEEVDKYQKFEIEAEAIWQRWTGGNKKAPLPKEEPPKPKIQLKRRLKRVETNLPPLTQTQLRSVRSLRKMPQVFERLSSEQKPRPNLPYSATGAIKWPVSYEYLPWYKYDLSHTNPGWRDSKMSTLYDLLQTTQFQATQFQATQYKTTSDVVPKTFREANDTPGQFVKSAVLDFQPRSKSHTRINRSDMKSIFKLRS